MTTLLLVRHGETDWNSERRWQGHADQPLNDVGRGQARALAATLVGREIDAVYASDLLRAHETAQILAEALELPVHVEPGLREVDVGSWSGKAHSEIEQTDPAGFARWREGGKGWDGGETYEEMGERVLEAVFRLAAAHDGETIVLVTHGGSIRACHAFAAEVDTATSRRLGFGSTGNCEVVELRVSGGRLAEAAG